MHAHALCIYPLLFPFRVYDVIAVLMLVTCQNDAWSLGLLMMFCQSYGTNFGLNAIHISVSICSFHLFVRATDFQARIFFISVWWHVVSTLGLRA